MVWLDQSELPNLHQRSYLMDFNCMSTYLGLFHAYRLEYDRSLVVSKRNYNKETDKNMTEDKVYI